MHEGGHVCAECIAVYLGFYEKNSFLFSEKPITVSGLDRYILIFSHTVLS